MIRRILNTVIETTFQQQSEGILYQHPFTSPETIAFGWLYNAAPCFPVKSTNINILSDPHQFYNILLQLSGDAKERITLASLYLGSGNLEKKLVESILTNRNFKERKLKVDILLDYTRGSRFTDNSRTTLLPLLNENEETCKVSLYHTPELRGALKKILPERWNELLGLQHMKLYIFDDHLLISGANLSNDYFTNRQDRYFIIKDRKLCDFYCGLVNRVQMFSFSLDKSNETNWNNGFDTLPYEGNRGKFVNIAGDSIENYMIEAKHEQNSHKTEGNDTWIFPMVQMGQLGIKQDSQITEQILREAPEHSTLNIATSYFNLTKEYMDTLIYNSRAKISILMAHPKANGFFGAKGFAGGIPDAYSLIAQNFKQCCDGQGKERIKLLEYLRDGWTYHGKGLWYYPPDSELPCLTLIGSPNFGERSVKRDLESQIAVVTENKELQKKLHDESKNLYKFGLDFEERECRKWVHGFIYFFRSYF